LAQRASFVTLSTTLATNAIVEGKGAEVGAIIAIPEPKIDWPLPPALIKVISGGHNVRGIPCAELDVRAIAKAAQEFRGRAEAVAISSYFSVRNPEHELRAKAILEETLDIPIVCGHEITASLGFRERTVTAILNARIIPIIRNLILAVKQVLKELNINAPLLIVKSDGSLMDEKSALMKPIKTVLSGPAASVFGALYLTRQSDAVVVDIGGTTTDVAIIEGGRPLLKEEGTAIRSWHTLVKSMDIATAGLGGDSYIRRSKDGLIQIGPQRVLPLSMLAKSFPAVIEELKAIFEEIKDATHREAYLSEPHDFVYLIKRNVSPFEENEKAIVEALKKGPIPIRRLARIANTHPDLLPLERLEGTGTIGRSGLTPTDALHARGIINIGEAAASLLGFRIMASALKTDERELIEGIEKRFVGDLTRHILNKVIASCLNLQKADSCPICKGLVDQALGHNTMRLLDTSLSLKIPLIGVGAPAGIYMPAVARHLGAKLYIPEHAEVANAVGTVVGNVVESAQIIIRKLDDTYLMFAPWERKAFDDHQEAERYAIRLGTTKIKEAITADGLPEPDVYIKKEEVFEGEILISVSAVRKPW
ncbi:MAG: hydantoinase/oxoprolinase family protein, partial [Thermacetogeniaceae bacterium]